MEPLGSGRLLAGTNNNYNIIFAVRETLGSVYTSSWDRLANYLTRDAGSTYSTASIEVVWELSEF